MRKRVRGVGQGGVDVVARQMCKRIKKVGFRRAFAELPQNELHREMGAMDNGLAPHHSRVDGDLGGRYDVNPFISLWAIRLACRLSSQCP